MDSYDLVVIGAGMAGINAANKWGSSAPSVGAESQRCK